MSRLALLVRLLPLPLALAAVAAAAPEPPCFAIEIVDDRTGRGVPLVELRTVNEVLYVTDNAGVAAIDDPELEGQRVFFHVRSHGYEFPADGFGMRGVALQVERGKVARIRIQRRNIAERLYRITGAGLYRDSLRIGRAAPIRQPLLNAQVFGSDSVQNAVYRGRLFWLWGDTSRPAYPLGNFHMSGATSRLPRDGGLDPDRGVELEYFVDEHGFAREMARMPGEGPTWLGGLVVLPEGGQERLFAGYAKIRNQLEAYERGLCRFDDARGRFEWVCRFPAGAPVYPTGHTHRRRENGVEYVYFGDPFPLVRVPATAEALRDLSRYEAYTCLQPGSRLDSADAPPRIDREANGRARYAWRRDAPPLLPPDQERWVREGRLRRDEALIQLRDVETGRPVAAHAGSVAWNAFRRRWIMIAVEIGGTSLLGEVWYAEADTPLGPWVYARKIVTHDRYSFYNPRHHPEFDQEGGRRIYFEGTYSASFSGNPLPTPRYDYNQVMYRLDLDDPRLRLPVPVSAGEGARPWRTGAPISPEPARWRTEFPFFAPDRPAPGTRPVVLREGRLQLGGAGTPLFYALPPDAPNPPATTLLLYEWTDPQSGARLLAPEGKPPSGRGAAFRRAEAPLCRVWRNPWTSE